MTTLAMPDQAEASSRAWPGRALPVLREFCRLPDGERVTYSSPSIDVAMRMTEEHATLQRNAFDIPVAMAADETAVCALPTGNELVPVEHSSRPRFGGFFIEVEHHVVVHSPGLHELTTGPSSCIAIVTSRSRCRSAPNVGGPRHRNHRQIALHSRKS